MALAKSARKRRRKARAKGKSRGIGARARVRREREKSRHISSIESNQSHALSTRLRSSTRKGLDTNSSMPAAAQRPREARQRT